MDLKHIIKEYNTLCEDNDWQVFHTPKNLASAVAVSASKILQHYQWITEEESITLGRIPQSRERIEAEISETFFYLLALANRTGIDFEQAIANKARKDARDYQGAPD
ncbi:MazG-like family protein [Simiduia aestuariiviva]|uniref:NTP pyrophosphatase (Non-canonical NTP hydrolase) n=1 Tax=Simiduia aestuariiviva TaxID=1510459 RepID=A0A839UHA2_9GAMM|nr:MazG-like family protein [Simiduia aestuariiviva]MBB3167414.1 NTP pyrophosphatase (non-canonical NTP hydrolase) [Simiduia aestuariiviva]